MTPGQIKKLREVVADAVKWSDERESIAGNYASDAYEISDRQAILITERLAAILNVKAPNA